ncbi:MAG: GNAT family N-acetyltransferase [Syntrophomonadaceae bacterium]|nr:GNAT family N-acetyltransferase [Syntrophomonadaceae bacterium]
MIIRPAREADRAQIIYLIQTMDGEDGLAPEEYGAIWNKINQYPYYKVFVVADGKIIIGTCSLIIIDNLGHLGARLAVAENLIISQEYRGQGIGRQLIQFIMARAQAENCYKLVLSSDKKRTSAHRFYEQLGFEQHGISFKVELAPNESFD